MLLSLNLSTPPPALFFFTTRLTRWLAVQIPLLPDNPTSPPSGTRWTPERWCPLDQRGWSIYTPHCCPGRQHLHLHRCQGSHRWGYQSWRWARWSPSECHRMCPPLSVTKREKQGWEGWGEGILWVISKLLHKSSTWGKKSDCRHKTSVPVPLDKCNPGKRLML